MKTQSTPPLAAVDQPRLVRQFRDVYELRLSEAEGRANLFEKAGNRTLVAIELGKAEAYKQVLNSRYMKTETTTKNQKPAVGVPRLVIAIFGQCWDCKKVTWPWQAKGIDGQSHRSCHRERCAKLMRDHPEMRQMIRHEVAEIESIYKR